MELESVVIVDQEKEVHEKKKLGCPMTINDGCMALFPIVIVSLFITSWVILAQPEEKVPCTYVPMTYPQCGLSAFADNQTFLYNHCHCTNPHCVCYVIRDSHGEVTGLTLNIDDVIPTAWMSVAVITTIVMLVFVTLILSKLSLFMS